MEQLMKLFKALPAEDRDKLAKLISGRGPGDDIDDIDALFEILAATRRRKRLNELLSEPACCKINNGVKQNNN